MATSRGSVVIDFPSRDTSVPSVTPSASAATGEAMATGHQIQGPAAAATIAPSGQLVTIQSLGGGRTLIHPLYIKVEQFGDEWLATSHDLALVGRGESDLEAVDDLRAGVAELFNSLSDMRDELGPLMRDQLAFLDRLAGLG